MALKSKKTSFFIILAFVAIFLLTIAHCSTINAAAPLENTYPTIPGTITPDTVDTPLPVLFKYIYNLSIILAGFIAFVVTVWGGLKYIFAGLRPGKLADAREQIGFGLVGMVLIFASYLIVNTINPDFTRLTIILPVDRFDTTPMPSDIDTTLPNIGLYEIPVGSIITSEFGASSFLATTSPDIDYPNVDWPIATTSTSTYDTDFQGALFGARLRRIHEVASTTVPVAKKLHELSTGLWDLVEECSCAKCSGNDYIACTTSADCGCDSGYLCPDNIRDKIRTRIDEVGFLKDAFKAFLNPDSLVEDYYNDNQSDIDGLNDDEIKDFIQMMIEVENKGGYSPETDPPERDVGRNLFEMTMLLNEMKKMKRMLNPYDQDMGYLNLLTFHEATTLETNTNMDSRVYDYYVIFTTGPEKIDEKNDPATFYSAAALPFPYGAPSTEPYNQYIPEPDLLPYLKKPQSVYPENIVYAQPAIPNVQFNFNTPPTTGGTCNYIVEIPIGRALDEAIKLTQAINKELFNIFVKGHMEIIGANMFKKTAEEFVDMKCSTGCQQPTCIEVPPLPPGCFPPSIPFIAGCAATLETLAWKANALIALWIIDLTTIPGMGLDIEDIETSFKKFDSQEPIVTDYVCENQNGNCRNSNGTININNVEKKEYTLEEKLIQVQKLLNRSRELEGQDNGRSVYEILLQDLIALGYDQNIDLLEYIRTVDAIERIDLQNCHIMSETILEIGRKTYGKTLVNCRNAKLLGMLDLHNSEICSPDPYLDANYYLDPGARDLRPISCYCYDEDADTNFYNKNRFPELYQDISITLPTFAADIEDLDQDALIDLMNQWQNAGIDFNNFSGFGNNYFCCTREIK
jgi:hypothetical protein